MLARQVRGHSPWPANAAFMGGNDDTGCAHGDGGGWSLQGGEDFWELEKRFPLGVLIGKNHI